jgi:3-methylcrotonyl-CoA carboxylase beta subunit
MKSFTATHATQLADLHRQEAKIQEGGGAAAIKRQHEKNRLTARERIARLIDPASDFFELRLWSGAARRRRAWSPASAWLPAGRS